jgi:hypothetical protein
MRRFRTLSVPQHAHPLVRQLFVEMNRERIGLSDVAERAGVAITTFKGWRTRHTPRVADLEACYNVLGLTLTVTKVKDD